MSLSYKVILHRLQKSNLCKKLQIDNQLSLKKIERFLNKYDNIVNPRTHRLDLDEIKPSKEIMKTILKFIKQTPNTRKSL